MPKVRNIMGRRIRGNAAMVSALLERLAGPDDPVWPSRSWPALVLDRGLAVGSRGGHGPIRYQVSVHEPGRLRFGFDRAVGLHGWHELTVEPVGREEVLVTHTIEATTHGWMRLLWPLAVRWLHEALLRDLLDNVERASTGSLARPPARWSLGVRALRRLAPS